MPLVASIGLMLTLSITAWAAICVLLYRAYFAPLGRATNRRGNHYAKYLSGVSGRLGPQKRIRTLPGDSWDVVTDDEVTLDVRHLHGRRNEVVVVAPGYRSSLWTAADVCLGLSAAGFHVVVFSWRGCANTTGGQFTFGTKEQRDLRAVLDAARGRLAGAKLGVLGLSLGAALAIIEAARDHDIAAVWADSPCVTPVDFLADRVRTRCRVPGLPFAIPVALYAWVRRGAKIWQVRTVDALRQLNAPAVVLVVSGSDSLVPPRRTSHILGAIGPSTSVWRVPEAEHAMARLDRVQEYVRRAVAFFEESLGADPLTVVDASQEASSKERGDHDSFRHSVPTSLGRQPNWSGTYVRDVPMNAPGEQTQ